MPDNWNIEESVRCLREEVDRLNKEQSKALESAIYLGMTPQQATEYDEHRKQILTLVNQLTVLETSR